MRRIESLIKLARDRVGVSQYTATSGISQNLCVQFLNDAQDHLSSVIFNVYPESFVAHKTISLSPGVEVYSVPDNLFANNRIISVDYSHSGEDRDYINLPQRTFLERETYSANRPRFYIRMANSLYINPITQTGQGTLRVTYYRELDDLDIRRGDVLSRTLGPAAITAISLDPSSVQPEDGGATAVSEADYICVVNRDGAIQMRNIPVTAYNSGSGAFTILGGSYTFQPGETVAVGDYVVLWKNRTTHSSLPDICERYLIVYLQKRLLTKDSSIDSLEEDVELKMIEAEIVSSFAQPTEDVVNIPIINPDILY